MLSYPFLRCATAKSFDYFGQEVSLNLISTQAFRLLPGKSLSWDMHRVVKRIEQDEKASSLCSHLKLKYFNFCEIFLQRNQSDFFLEPRGHFTKIKNFHKMAAPQLYQAQEKIDLSIFSKQELSSFRVVLACDSFR